MCPEFTLQHFIYSLHPETGSFAITAHSSGVDPREWRSFCTPPPIDISTLDAISPVYSFQKLKNHAVASLFLPGPTDEWDRAGIYSHHIIIDIEVYKQHRLSPSLFIEHFVTDASLVGDIPPITISLGKSTMSDSNTLNDIDSSTLTAVLDAIVHDNRLVLVLPEKDTRTMTITFSAITSLLPPNMRIVPFITAPLGRDFKREFGEKRYSVKLFEEKPGWVSDAERCIVIGEENEPDTSKRAGSAAALLVEEYQRNGLKGLEPLHDMWERVSKESSDPGAIEKIFINRFNVSRDTISFSSLKQKTTQAPQAVADTRQYVKLMLDEKKWRNAEELTEMILETYKDSLTKNSKGDSIALIKVLEGLTSEERLTVIESLLDSSNRISQELLAYFKKTFGVLVRDASFDYSLCPKTSSLVFESLQYVDFQEQSLQILKNSAADSALFSNNMAFLMKKVRERFPEKSLDFTILLCQSFAQYTNKILSLLTPEDVLPPAVQNRIHKDSRQFAVSQVEKLVHLLKST